MRACCELRYTGTNVVAYFTVESQHLHAETKEKKETPLLIITGLPLEIRTRNLPTTKLNYNVRSTEA